MPSRGRKFITEFLLPSLNEERFGSRLMWLDIEKKVFQMQWNHKSASDWTTSDAAVFAAWDKRKGHYKPDEKEYYTKSKQRFRAALNKFIKLKHITELYSEEKYTKIYCIGNGQNIFGTHTPAAKSEKENEGNGNTSQKVKQGAEDLVLNLNIFLNAGLLSEENSLVAYQDHEMENEGLIKEEKVVSDFTVEYIPDSPHSENSQNYIQTLNSSSDNKKNLSARETSNVKKESGMKLCETEAVMWKKDDYLKREETIENGNFHDYLCSVMVPSRQVEWPNDMFNEPDGDFSFGTYHLLHIDN